MSIAPPVVLVLGLLGGIAYGQPRDARAALIQRYANVSELSASFHAVETSATTHVPSAFAGKLWVHRPDAIRCDVFAASGAGPRVSRTVIVNGTSAWLVDHERKQLVTGVATVLPAALTFALGPIPFAGYRVRTSTADEVELEATQSGSAIQRVQLAIDPVTGDARRVTVTATNGDTTTVSFDRVEEMASPTTWFVVNPAVLPSYAGKAAPASLVPLAPVP